MRLRRRLEGSMPARLLFAGVLWACCSAPPSQAFVLTPSRPLSSPTSTVPHFTHYRLSASLAFHHDEPDRPASSAMAMVDFSGVRDAIRVGQVSEALKDVASIRSLGEPIPQGLYEELLLRSANRHRLAWLQVCREALELYLVDAAQLGLHPSAKVLKTVLEATSKAGDVNGSLVLLRLLATYQPQVLKEYHFFLVLDCCAMARRMSLVGGVLEQMDRLRVPRSVYIYSALIKGYGRQKWAKQLEEVVEELLSQRVVRPDVVLMNTVIDALIRCDEPRKARELLLEMEQQQQQQGEEGGDGWRLPRPDLYTYNTVLKGLKALGDLTALMDLYRGMQRAGVQPDSVTVNTLVGAAVALGNLSKAAQLLEKSDVPASVEGYSALLQGFVQRGDFEKAEKVLQMMKAQGVNPNVQTYTSLLSGAAKSGDLDRMMAIFNSMLAQGAQDPSVRPNVWTYNNVLAALIRRGRLDEALGVWASLKQQAAQEQQQGGGVRADVVTVNTLLDGLLSAEPPRVREAELLFMEMVEGGTQPDEYTFSILLKAYGPEDAAPEDARKSGPNRLLDMVMLNRDISLDTTAVNTLLFALMRTGDWKRSIVFFDDFKAGNMTRGVPGIPDVITYTILIKGVADSHNMYSGAKIMQLYREMRRRYRIRPDRRIVNAIVNSLAKSRSRLGGLEMEDLEEVYEDLRSLGWSEKQLEALEQQSWSYAGLYSEAWKDARPGPAAGQKKGGNPPRSTVSSKLFDKYGWNVVDSSFGPL